MTRLLSTRRVTFRPIAVAVLTVLVAALLAAAPTAHKGASAEAVSVVFDNFDREVEAGWGEATSGHVYRVSPNLSASAVNGDKGVIRLTPGLFTTHTLDVTELDAALVAQFSLDSLGDSGNGVTASLGQRTVGAYSYQARLRAAPDGRLTLWISRYDGTTAQETIISSAGTVGDDVEPGATLNLEFSVSGTDEVELKARGWVLGSTVPDWQITSSDSSAERLTDSGSASFGAYLSRGSSGVTVGVNEIALTRSPSDSGAPSPDPSAAEPSPSASPTPSPSPSATPTPAPIQTPPPEPGPSPDPAPTAPAESGRSGALPVGGADYAVPPGAIFAAPRGTVGGDGTASSPYASAQHAIDQAASGSTIVLRGGVYHESIRIPFDRELTIQPYPNEEVWFDGAESVTGFSRSGSTWVKTGWNHIFDPRVSFTAGRDETSWWVDPEYPMAGHPDQVWIDGVAMTQVGSAGAVTAGTFYVDRSGNRLIIGDDPSGKRVEASTLNKAIQVNGTGSTLRGFGVKRYATTVSQMGAVSAEVDRITLENLVISENATVGLYTWGKDVTLRGLTVSDNGLMGLGANTAHRLEIDSSEFSGNNRERFRWLPVSGGTKITKSDDVRISDSKFIDNHTMGAWFDDSAYNVTVTGSTFEGNPRTGLLVEATENVTVADNYFASNGRGLIIYNTGSVEIWNNTFAENDRSLEFMQDERRSGNDRTPWLVQDVTVSNNVIAFGSGTCPILTQDQTNRMAGNDFGISLDGNLYWRADDSTPRNFACWWQTNGTVQAFTTLTAFSAHTGQDLNSSLVQGEPVVDSKNATTSVADNATGLVTRALPSRVAHVVGVPGGTAQIGAISGYR